MKAATLMPGIGGLLPLFRGYRTENTRWQLAQNPSRMVLYPAQSGTWSELAEIPNNLGILGLVER